MRTLDAIAEAKRQGIGTALLLLAETDSVRAYYLLKQLGLCIAELQEVGFTETDLEPLKEGWREVQKRMAARAFGESDIINAGPGLFRHRAG